LSPPRRPARLRPGSRIALISPAGPVAEDAVERALERCARWGLEAVRGRNARSRHGFLAGPDEERMNDLRTALADPAIDAVWALRGGYGTMRLLPRLDSTRPGVKAFIGFSDNTALHAWLARGDQVTFHGPHAGGAFPAFTERCFRHVLFDAGAGVLPPPPGVNPPAKLIGGAATGRLAGGNLTMLASLCGTPWSPVLRDRILVLEDVGEAAYRLDRSLTQLRLAGCLEDVRGVVLGRFTNRPERTEERPLNEVLGELLAPLDVPVLADAPVGHIDDQWTLPLGALARLDADAGTLELLEPGVE